MSANSGQTPADIPFIRLSLSARYAVAGLRHLAQNPEKYCLVEEVARDQSLPKNFLGKIFQRLTHNGFLVSQRGRGGGYALAQSADKVSLMQVLRVVEGVPTGKKQCLLGPHPCGTGRGECALHEAAVEADKRLRESLDNISLKDLA